MSVESYKGNTGKKFILTKLFTLKTYPIAIDAIYIPFQEGEYSMSKYMNRVLGTVPRVFSSVEVI
ncbi:MAG: hypothetical protein AYK18_14590 [Theionarchaea archaeon DG-70]|nr:MAG: hypothetical protein AYK18_14590 [Theionarchaea archaeon DG-70]